MVWLGLFFLKEHRERLACFRSGRNTFRQRYGCWELSELHRAGASGWRQNRVGEREPSENYSDMTLHWMLPEGQDLSYWVFNTLTSFSSCQLCKVGNSISRRGNRGSARSNDMLKVTQLSNGHNRIWTQDSSGLKLMFLINLPPQVNNTTHAGWKWFQEEFLMWEAAWDSFPLKQEDSWVLGIEGLETKAGWGSPGGVSRQPSDLGSSLALTSVTLWFANWCVQGYQRLSKGCTVQRI